ncbi:orotidine-5'-phosphate decarboxylase [Luteimicrobium sp. NPDC057192]|uniref:orotidine-5'-phosphate decarboxylase n=1 Tax=Luteimicrobium sp. NPDC057192 TaxID=3346042 RepID=UPI003625DB86
MTAPFGARLAAAMDERGPLCVGIDPHATLLDAWGLPDDAAGVREFGLRVVEAVGGRVPAVKPQAAFFERHGSRGVAALEDVIAAAQAAGTLVVVDAKRGDIGSTMDAYAEAFLRDGSPLAGDALTVSPYLGFGSLEPAVDLALATGRGLFVLCLTSNKEGHEVQHARTLTVDGWPNGPSVAATMAAHAAALNADVDPMGSIGLVVGATVGDAAERTATDLTAVNGPLLAPGVGAQGGGPAELASVFGKARRQVLASSSRGVLRAGPDLASLRRAADEASAEARSALRD